MKSSTKDKIKGLTDKVKGKVKEGLGGLSGNRDPKKRERTTN
ncbi:MAG: hypothetical protein ABSG91_22725 [Syntrophobacteraceae bacterium]